MKKNSHLNLIRGLNHLISGRVAGFSKMEFYPSFDDLPDGGIVEVYIYDIPHTEKIDNKKYVLTPEGQGVEAYFLRILQEDEEIIEILSKDNIFEQSSTISDSDKGTLDLLKIMKDDITIFFDTKSYPKSFQEGYIHQLKEAGGFIGGYIVKNESANVPLRFGLYPFM